MESADMGSKSSVFDIALPAVNDLHPRFITIGNSRLVRLEGDARITGNGSWDKSLYKQLPKAPPAPIPVKLVPYYAWPIAGKAI